MKLKTSLHRIGNAIDLLHNAWFYKAPDEINASLVMQRIDGLGDLLGFGEKGAVATACLLGTKGRIHENYVISLVAQVHEGEASHGVLGEEPSLKLVTIQNLLGVVAKNLNDSGFGLLKELIVGDVREIEE